MSRAADDETEMGAVTSRKRQRKEATPRTCSCPPASWRPAPGQDDANSKAMNAPSETQLSIC
jgi:hypothetical protein